MLGVRLLIGAPLGRISARGMTRDSFDDIVDHCCYAWNTRRCCRAGTLTPSGDGTIRDQLSLAGTII
jgi:hypothetical protein